MSPRDTKAISAGVSVTAARALYLVDAAGLESGLFPAGRLRSYRQGENRMTKVPGLFIGAFALMLATAPNLSAQTLAATLNGGEETPILNTGAVGTAEVSVDVANQEILVTLRVFNAPTPTTAGHIHIGPVGIAGPVVINFPEALVGRTGDFAMTFRVGPPQFVARPAIGINTMEDAMQAILNGNSYVNIHTQQFPGGEIRGQLNRVK